MENEEVKVSNEENEIEEIQKEMKIKKEKDLKPKNPLGAKIFNIIFWIVIVGLFVIWIIDFMMVKMEKKPIFCLNKETYTYDDGTVDKCVGLGYKVYEYKLTNKNAVEFGPFFIKMDLEDNE